MLVHTSCYDMVCLYLESVHLYVMLFPLILVGNLVCSLFVIFHVICVLVLELALIQVEKLISCFFALPGI